MVHVLLLAACRMLCQRCPLATVVRSALCSCWKRSQQCLLSVTICTVPDVCRRACKMAYASA
eukprot:3013562-Amphidinium_carterae.1